MPIDDFLTPQEAVEAGYASSAGSIYAQIKRGVLLAKQLGKNRYVIHKIDLEDLKNRREFWVKHRFDKKDKKICSETTPSLTDTLE